MCRMPGPGAAVRLAGCFSSALLAELQTVTNDIKDQL